MSYSDRLDRYCSFPAFPFREPRPVQVTRDLAFRALEFLKSSAPSGKTGLLCLPPHPPICLLRRIGSLPRQSFEPTPLRSVSFCSASSLKKLSPNRTVSRNYPSPPYCSIPARNTHRKPKTHSCNDSSCYSWLGQFNPLRKPTPIGLDS